MRIFKKKIIFTLTLILVLTVSGIFLLKKWCFNPERIANSQEKTWEERILRYNYKEYNPIVFQQDQLIEAPELSSKEHIKNVIHVLKYYGEKWKIENDKLFISNDIDEEIVWNYTTKANDSIWLNEHLKK